MSKRSDLAYAYQILAYLQLDDHTYTHLSLRNNADAFYIYPFGLRFAEVTPNCLLEVSLDGAIMHGREYQYNKTGYILHGNLYKARSDVQAIFHIHTPAMVAVSALKVGLLPITQWALHFYEHIRYHDYNSLALSDTQGQDLVRDLDQERVILLRNHGAIICGRTIQEAMFFTYHLEQACKTQCLILAMQQEIVAPSPEICKQAVQDLLSFEPELGMRDWQAWVRLVQQLHTRHSTSSAQQLLVTE